MIQVKRIKKLDECVINKIAAGEIIQRPANAIKELLENSFDAGSTQIIITVKQGGLGIIQIQDNGSGICKDDFPILCEKFTTSKLQEFGDLLNIATFGFRGEALASITHVARVQITSKTEDSPCAYRADFCNSQLLNSPKPCAGNTGTIVRVEDLFYNIPIRKSTLSNIREEFSKILEVVSSYALLKAGKCSITLKRSDETANSTPDVRVVAGTEMDDAIVALYDGALAQQLLQVKHTDVKLGYSLDGRVSKPSYSGRRTRFILFINNRLVHCALLKKSIESVYATILPKQSFGFVFLDLQLPPANLDVNVHPTKYEVHFLHQELIVAAIQDRISTAISATSESRSFSTQSLLNKTAVSKSGTTTNPLKSFRPSEKVRVDPKELKIKSFFSNNNSSQNLEVTQSNSIKHKTISPQTSIKKEDSLPFSVIPESFNSSDQSKLVSKSSVLPMKTSTNTPQQRCSLGDLTTRYEELAVLDELRQAVLETSEIACDWSSLVYVGMVDRHRFLVQRDTDLLLLHCKVVNYNLFYQLCLERVGNVGFIELVDGNHDQHAEENNQYTLLKDLFAFGIQETGDLYDGLDVTKAIDMLREHAALLLDCFGVKIDIKTMTLIALPLLLDKFIPDLRGLPKFVVNLCTKVNWSDGRCRLHGICREIAEFYSSGIGSATSLSADRTEFGAVFENVILPLYRSFLRIPASFEHDGTLVRLTSLPDLYNVFERC